MKRDFTLSLYGELLEALRDMGYVFIRVEDYFDGSFDNNKFVILRHDVDRDYDNALEIGNLEKLKGIRSTYYFRVLPMSFSERVINSLIEMGHEIGYHYEDLSLSGGDYEKSLKMFEEHLMIFRRYYDVRTICMHGSPLSRWNSLSMWDRYDYRRYGIIGEPFKDIDYNKVFYLTDTGRGWNKNKYSLRDKVETRYDYEIRDTYDLISKIKGDESFPSCLMINTHSNRWYDGYLKWGKEYVTQGLKNIVKMGINKFMKKS